MSYHFSREPLRVANITVQKHAEHIIRLYEQQKTKKATPEEMALALVLGLYVKRWRRWCGAKCSFYATAHIDAVFLRCLRLPRSIHALPEGILILFRKILGSHKNLQHELMRIPDRR